MTKQQAIKKYNLKLKEIKDNFETRYKNKYVRIAKTDSYRHKTICRTYEIKGEYYDL